MKKNPLSFDELTYTAFNLLEGGPRRLVKLLALFTGLLVVASVLL